MPFLMLQPVFRRVQHIGDGGGFLYSTTWIYTTLMDYTPGGTVLPRDAGARAADDNEADFLRGDGDAYLSRIPYH